MQLILKDSAPNNAQTYVHNPFLFVYATLVSPDSDQEIGLMKDVTSRLMAGSIASSLHRLKDIDNTYGGFFVFPDISVRREGLFRLKFSLYEILGNNSGYMVPTKVVKRLHVYSNTFTIYSPKFFPGNAESTPLSRFFAEQGLKIRIRKDSAQPPNLHIKPNYGVKRSSDNSSPHDDDSKHRKIKLEQDGRHFEHYPRAYPSQENPSHAYGPQHPSGQMFDYWGRPIYPYYPPQSMYPHHAPPPPFVRNFVPPHYHPPKGPPMNSVAAQSRPKTPTAPAPTQNYPPYPGYPSPYPMYSQPYGYPWLAGYPPEYQYSPGGMRANAPPGNQDAGLNISSPRDGPLAEGRASSSYAPRRLTSGSELVSGLPSREAPDLDGEQSHLVAGTPMDAHQQRHYPSEYHLQYQQYQQYGSYPQHYYPPPAPPGYALGRPAYSYYPQSHLPPPGQPTEYNPAGHHHLAHTSVNRPGHVSAVYNDKHETVLSPLDDQLTLPSMSEVQSANSLREDNLEHPHRLAPLRTNSIVSKSTSDDEQQI